MLWRNRTYPAGLLASTPTGPSVVMIGLRFSPFLLLFCPLLTLVVVVVALITFLAGLNEVCFFISPPFIMV